MKTLPGAGKSRLDIFVNGNLIWFAKTFLEHNKSARQKLTDEQKRDLERTYKIIKPAYDHLLSKLSNDTDHTSLFELLKAAYLLGGYSTPADLQRSVISKREGKSGGIKSGEKRKEQAQQEWHGEAKKLAEKKLQEDPNAPIATIAGYIEDHFKGPHLRSYDTFKRQVAIWLKDGTLKR